jgi:hypothetical protein
VTEPTRPRPDSATADSSGGTDTPGGTDVTTARRTALNEDWAATVVGLVLLALVLTGVLPGWLVP